jgi:hypothetical protein
VSTAAPEISAADAERIAREHYGIDERAAPLPGELDLNFALGERYVLKIYSPDADRALDLQDAALEHLAGLDTVPRLVRTVDGAARADAARMSSHAPYGSTRRHSSRLPHLHPPRPSQHPAARAQRLDDHGGWSARHADRGLEAVARRGHDRAALRPDAPARHLR